MNGANMDILGKWEFDTIMLNHKNNRYFYDLTGNGNNLNISSDNYNVSFDIFLKRNVLCLDKQYFDISMNSPLPYLNMSEGWKISALLKCGFLGTEQVFICKEGAFNAIQGDLSIGYDNSQYKFFIEVTDRHGKPARIFTDCPVKVENWYKITASGTYLSDGHSTIDLIVYDIESNNQYMASMVIDGYPLPHRASRWVIGRGYPSGFPNSLSVLNGALGELTISRKKAVRKPGENPIFNSCFTADPALMIVNGTAFIYAGVDMSNPGGWFNMPHWVCFSSKDMINWMFHGVVLSSADFPNATSNSAWACHVIERNGKYYFYATLDNKNDGHHMIDVAVSDSPLGPFIPARKNGYPLISDDMTLDSHRKNADIDPVVFMDEKGTAWIAWGNGDFYISKLKDNMIELDGEIHHIPVRNCAEGAWIFRRNNKYYNVYAADAPGIRQEQIAYSMADSPLGPWEYKGILTGPAKYGFTIHPAIGELNGQWYFFYHDGGYDLNGTPGGDCRRQVCVEYLNFNSDGTICPIELTREGISVLNK